MTTAPVEPVAIVGIGCRFPGGANTPSKLWELLEEKRDILKLIPPSRFDEKGFYDADGERSGCMNARHAYTLDEDISQFDSSFFKTNALEAEAMDPQQRNLLEVVYEALESAGCVMEHLHGSDTSVYVGSMTGDYHEMLLRDPEDMPRYMATGTARSILSNRVSYFFNWKGPSMTIDTACSSSLVALHEAVQSLRQGVSQVACAAGANLILGPEMMIAESKMHMLSPSGRSRMWDAAADGYARGEGFSAVILKTVSQAIADGDYIHAIVRETGVNSDGRTNGITLPSSSSQTALIRQTYARAGIDLNQESCQYFEAHGTGTPAGDPIEARAIWEAFPPSTHTDTISSHPLFVGSVKTNIGHLEGCAGLAGLVKAAEAVRRGVVPPNMLYETLNPAIAQYTDRLQVPTATLPWPELPDGSPRRASVNSFGFGGTNAHAIVESFENKHLDSPRPLEEAISPIPLVLSADSEISLRSLIASFQPLLESSGGHSPADLAFTLQTRRSQHAVRAAFPGRDRSTLLENIQSSLGKEGSIGVRIEKNVTYPRIMGVFTGQGAQWPTMGRELLRVSPVAREIVHQLQDSLARLPDPPSWALVEELQAGSAVSRLAEASVAQPLCTAVQIILVDLLRLAGTTFNIVVGHSSGEIGAAYAAGMITAEDGIRIAYYRGVHAKLARGSNGEQGAMMAAGMSYDEACTFCEELFPGRLDVAASNAPASVTLSGNEDAIHDAKTVLDNQGKFTRALRVNTAYHSPHMVHCSEAYLQSLEACSIRPRPTREDCVWISSVHGYRMHGHDHVQSLTGEYWNDNMLNPVLFSIAVEAAVTSELPCDVAVELGPHPSLKSPFGQTVKQVAANPIAYTGTLSRGHHDVDALSETLGFLWMRLGSSAVDFGRYATAFSNAPQSVVDLPVYPWDHRQSYWKESNKSANFRQRSQPRHPLLGVRSNEDIDQSLRWNQTLRLGELPWLEGHKVEGLVIYPAAAYLVMAIEACSSVIRQRSVKLVDLYDVDISNAISLSHDAPAVDVLFSLCPADSDAQSKTTTAEWSCYSRMGAGKAAWRLNARGHVRLVFGHFDHDTLPPRTPLTGSLVAVDVDRFYETLTTIGLNYTSAFRSVAAIHRRSGAASAVLPQIPSHPISSSIHPATLDAAFQSVFAAFCWPGDGSLRAPFVPTKIDSLRIVNGACLQATQQMLVDASIIEASGQDIVADLGLSSAEDDHKTLVQIEGLRCSCLTPPGPHDYKEVYSKNVWEQDISSGIAPNEGVSNDAAADLQLVDICERLSYYYLRKLNSEIDRGEVPGMEWHFQRIFEWIDHLFPWIESGTHPTIRREWASEDPSWLFDQVARFPDSVDLQLISVVGNHLRRVVRRQTTVLEHMMHDDVLDRFYKSGLGFHRANGSMGRATKQIAHRYPRAKILEIGAGTGGATKEILESLGSAFESYTYTDISTGFFEAAAAAFQQWEQKMTFRPLNVEADLSEQGYEGQTFDIIIASNVLHATKNLSVTMQNVRRLLNPGGFLVLLEVTSDIVRVKLMMSGLPGWWLGGDDGRRHGPTITRNQWDSLLKETGFSGVDDIVHDFNDASKHMTSVMVSQAFDENVLLLRRPLLHPSSRWSLPPTTIVGGRTACVAAHTQRILSQLPGQMPQVQRVDSLADLVAYPSAMQATTLVILEDLDDGVLKSFSRAKLEGLQQSLPQYRHLLWVSRQCRSSDPYGNMSVGLCRALAAEHTHVALQHLDLESDIDQSTPTVIAEAVVRLAFGSSIDSQNQVMWTTEPEVRVKNGQMFVPRILPDQSLNDRLNARKMAVKISLSATDGVEILPQANRYVLSEPVSSILDAHDTQVKIRVLYSLLSAVRVGQRTTAFVSYGHPLDNPALNVIAFSGTNSSIVATSPALVFPVLSVSPGPALLQMTAFAILAEHLMSSLSPGDTVALRQTDKKLSAVLEQRASELGVRLLTVSAHPYATQSSLQHIVPPSTKLVLDFTPDIKTPWERILSTQCEVVAADDLFADVSQGNISTASGLLGRAFDWTRQQAASHRVENTIPIADLTELPPADIPYSSVVDFTHSGTLQAVARPLDPPRLFQQNKTYLLAGFTGGLGQVLCRWMVVHGARFLALTTRQPEKVNSVWLDELREHGAQVSILGADVADMASLAAACAQVQSSMPPVAGVANAAMVLADRSFAELKVGDFNSVWGPKVQGTKNLDQLFHNHPLDFFIMFSSLASIVGNRGQSNYVAANLFMSTIAEQRRQRGLAASVMHIGMVLGVGYVSSTGIYESTLRQHNYMPIAEPEFLEMFSEAVLVGRPHFGHSPELITGLNRHSLQEDAQKPFWHENLRFSHHTVAESRQTELSSLPKASLTQCIQEAASLDEVDGAIQDAFCSKIERMLQAPRESIERQQPLINMGVDSLIAVEIRSWFVKELEVDMPVLKVLGGASVTELCHDAATKVWTESVRAPLAAAPPAGDVCSSPFACLSFTDPIQAIVREPVPEGRRTTESHPLAVSAYTITDSSSSATPLFSSGSVASSGSRSPPHSRALSEEAESGDDAPKPVSITREFRIERRSPLSFAQERLWFLRGYLRDPTTYNVTISYDVTGPLDLKALQNAFSAVIQRHESLRTCYYTDPDTNIPTQAVLSHSNFRVELRVDSSLATEFDCMRQHVYDLEHGQSLRVVIISHSPSQHFLVIGFHHIAFDGFSSQTLIRDLTTAYGGHQLPPAPPQYIDFTTDQRSQGLELEQHDLQYWKQEFADPPPTLPLLDFAETKSRVTLADYKLRTMTRSIPSDIASCMRSTTRGLGCTPFHVHLSVLQVLLHRLLAVDDMCIGVTDANKTDHQFLDTIGFFVNLLPIRFRLAANSSFADIVAQTKNKTHQGLAHSHVSIDRLLDELRVPRTTSHHPLFQVAINYKMGSTQSVPLGQCKARAVDFEDARNAYDLHFDIEMLSDGSSHLTVQTQSYLYTGHELAVLIESYFHLLRHMCQDPGRDIKTVPKATPGSFQRALELSHGSLSPPPQFLTLSRWAEHWALAQPTGTATSDDRGIRFSYAQVVSGANQLAHRLVGAGVKHGDRVGVYCEPSSNIIVYIIGIHKAGGVYVPLDVQNPVSRLNLMVQDCQPAVILCDEATTPRAAEFETDATIIYFAPQGCGASDRPFADASSGSSAACIIYTSGTTGVPKGVVVRHSNLAFNDAALRSRYAVDRETVLQQTSWGFDVSLAQIYHGIIGGGRVVVASTPTRRDPAQLARLMQEEGVTFTMMTPTQALSVIRCGTDELRACSKWHFAFISGEAFPARVVDEFKQLRVPGLQVFNAYGPSEATAHACAGADELSMSAPNDTRSPPIGHAIPNYSAYILDGSQHPVPLGFAGELCIGGAGVTKEYLNHADLTESKFLHNPFAQPEWIERGWDRLYRTGDKVKCLPDGRIVYLGRIAGDSQRKLRGFRIELEDIASTIVQASGGLVSDAAASIREDPESGDSENDVLVAFAVLSASQASPAEETPFLDQLRTSLSVPQYMRPSRILPVNSLPMTPSGKLDQAAVDLMSIPAPQSPQNTDNLSATQRQLRALWMETLRICDDTSIAADTDFFGLGGNSLRLVKLQSLIAGRLGTTIPVFELFQASTLGAMTSKLTALDTFPTTTDVDWDQETSPTLLSAALCVNPNDNAQDATTNLEVLLTGATGFLGSALLCQLVDDPAITKIHCIAIRAESDSAERALAVSSPKIIQYGGDLSHPLLGLSQEHYAHLSQRVHRIIHNGAAVSFLQSYTSLRASNTDSTKVLVALAAPRRIPFHFVSSAGVVNLTGEDGLFPRSVAAYRPPADGRDGYSSSKWASEVYLERCTEVHGLPVWIHRPSIITGAGAPTTDLMHRVIQASLTIRALPALPSWRGNFDWVSVEETAAGISAGVHATPSRGPVFVHHCAARKVPVAGLKHHLEAQHGVELATLTTKEWLARVNEHSLLDAPTEALARDVLNRKDAVLPSLRK